MGNKNIKFKDLSWECIFILAGLMIIITSFISLFFVWDNHYNYINMDDFELECVEWNKFHAGEINYTLSCDIGEGRLVKIVSSMRTDCFDCYISETLIPYNKNCKIFDVDSEYEMDGGCKRETLVKK